MTIVKTQLGTDESARRQRFEPTGTISATNVQKAIEEAASESAPTDATYVVASASSGLSAERVATSSTSITVDTATVGQIAFKRAALTGDVTASADTNSTTIANDAVTFAKMQNIATNSLIGRDTGSSGDPENILLNATLEMDGSLNLQRAALTGDVTASAGSNATTIANDAVTYAKMQDVSATDKILGRVSSGSGVVEEITFTDQAQQLADDTSFADMRTTLGVAYGKQTIWVPATAMVARTTNGAASGTAEMTTNKNMVKTLDFDASTQEFAQFDIRMPKSWNESTVTFIPVWSHAATVTNFGVVWGLDAVAVSDDDTLDVAFGTEQTSTDTGGTTNDMYHGPESSAITIAGTPAAGDSVMYRIHRNVSDGSDTMSIDARLHGVVVLYTNDTTNDT